MKNVIKVFLALIVLSISSCGGPTKLNSTWNFLGLEIFQIKSISSNSTEKLTIAIEGSVEENETKILELLSKAGYSPATKIHELLDFSGKVDDYKLSRLVIDNDPFEELKNNRCFVNQKQGVKCTVYDYFDEGTHIRLEAYTINNTIDLHKRAVELRKSMLFGRYSLTDRKYSNLNEFKGEDLEVLKTFEPAFKLLNNTLKLNINEDGTYEESFPFMEGDLVIIKGNWKLSEDFKHLSFHPSDLSGENLVDSYFLKNEIETELSTKANLIRIKKDGFEISTPKYKGVRVSSSFLKLN